MTIVSAIYPDRRCGQLYLKAILTKRLGTSERLSVGAPVALELAKKSMDVAASSGAPGESGLEFEAQSAAVASQTEDAAEGVESFLSKKKPEFKGRRRRPPAGPGSPRASLSLS